jgi:hypothetical protein
MTSFGKILTFLNVFASFGVLSWAVSSYVNRVDYLDTVGPEKEKIEGQITLMQKDITRLGRSAVEANSSYGSKANALSVVEKSRDYRLGKYASRLKAANDGSFRVQIMESVDSQFTDVEREGQIILGPDNKPLRGVAVLQTDFSKEARDAQLLMNGKRPVTQQELDQIDKVIGTDAFVRFKEDLGTQNLRVVLSMLSDRIAATDVSTAKQREIMVNLRDEARFLGDKRVNWQADLQTVERRQFQLENRLKVFGVAPRVSK